MIVLPLAKITATIVKAFPKGDPHRRETLSTIAFSVSLVPGNCVALLCIQPRVSPPYGEVRVRYGLARMDSGSSPRRHGSVAGVAREVTHLASEWQPGALKRLRRPQLELCSSPSRCCCRRGASAEYFAHGELPTQPRDRDITKNTGGGHHEKPSLPSLPLSALLLGGLGGHHWGESRAPAHLGKNGRADASSDGFSRRERLRAGSVPSEAAVHFGGKNRRSPRRSGSR